jgi:predicted nucleotidyltransferase
MPALSRQSSLRFPLSEILGSYNHVRVLRELARHGGELTTSEISRLSGVAIQNVRPIVASLESLHVLAEIGSGRSRLFRIRREHPLIGALEVLFETEGKRFNAVLQAVREASAQEGKDVLAVWLYGSTARGEDIATSDIDIVVVAPPESRQRVVSNLRERLQPAENTLFFTASVVGLDIDDVRRLQASQDPWWANVIRDAMPLLGPDPLTLALRSDRH